MSGGSSGASIVQRTTLFDLDHTSAATPPTNGFISSSVAGSAIGDVYEAELNRT